MFLHNFKYSLKVILANKMLLFWTFIFPIVLGTFFSLAFSNIESSEMLDIIDVVVVDDDNLKNNQFFKEAFDSLSVEGESQLFDTRYTSLDEAKDLLEKDEITGYVVLNDDNADIVVNSNGINETILRYVVDKINGSIDMTEKLAVKEVEKSYQVGNTAINYEDIYSNISLMLEDNNVVLNNVSNSNLSYTMIEYYTLIAMSCLYGGILSMFITNYRLANMKAVGKRTSVSPIKKGGMLLGSLFSSYVIQLLGVALLFLYTIFVLKVDYGSHLPQMLLLAAVGSLAGLSLGVCIACLLKTNENAKIGILIAFVMLGCFLSGMMGITMKYVIDKNIPFVNRLNPAAMITDGFYALYYYGTYDRYYMNVCSLVLFSFLMIVVSIYSLRRTKYDSI